MKLGQKLKRDTQLIIVSVIILTIVSMSVSYSAFFAVRSETTIQKITTGTLNVLIDSTSTAMNVSDLFPTSASDLPASANSVASGEYAKLVITNSGSLDSKFSVTLSRDTLPTGKTESDAVSFQYINIGIYDVSNTRWVNFGTESAKTYYTAVTGIVPNSEGAYPILSDTISANATHNNSREYRVYVWLDENTPTSEIGKLVYLKLDVKSATVNGRVES